MNNKENNFDLKCFKFIDFCKMTHIFNKKSNEYNLKSIHFFNKKEYVKSKYTLDFDSKTINEYKTMRIMKIDPISRENILEKYAFTVNCMWDPLTGEKKR